MVVYQLLLAMETLEGVVSLLRNHRETLYPMMTHPGVATFLNVFAWVGREVPGKGGSSRSLLLPKNMGL
jgi:hypothetical protein